MKVFLTGSTGFIGAHVLKLLVERGHEVVIAVRTESKAREVLSAYPNNKNISHVIVPDITAPGAYHKAVQEASPFQGDYKKELLDPAVQGTTSILKAIKEYAPSVKKIVITSSMAAVMNPFAPSPKYTEQSWDPVTEEQALSDPVLAYVGSKTFAEKVAWDFIKTDLPSVELSTINPPAVLGPVIHHLDSLENINTSNGAIAALIQGQWKDSAPPTFTSPWVDVRDVALAHVLALEKDEAAGRRFLLHGGFLTHADYVAIAKKNFASLAEKFPESTADEKPSDPEVDTEPAQQVLGLEFTSLEKSVTDTISSLLKFV